jgi:hypothetical protein
MKCCLACVKRAKQFVSDAKEVFRVAEHRYKGKSVPAKAIEMFQLKTMAIRVLKVSEDHEAVFEVEEAQRQEEIVPIWGLYGVYRSLYGVIVLVRKVLTNLTMFTLQL